MQQERLRVTSHAACYEEHDDNVEPWSLGSPLPDVTPATARVRELLDRKPRGA